MSLPLSDRTVSTALVVLLMFGVVSALCGAVMGIAFNESDVLVEQLAGTAFSFFPIPGLILGILVLALLRMTPEFVSSWNRHRGREEALDKPSQTRPPNQAP